jgi:hypothetical protein
MSALSHPVAVTLPRDQVAAQFVRITQDSLPDPNWHFHIALPKTARRSAQAALSPAPDGQLVSLGFFHIPQPAADIEVYGALLSYELDPADFLDFWMQKNGLTPLSTKRLPTLGGAIGDVLVSWPADAAFLGRCFCLKFGPRLIVVWCRCAKADYEALAETFFLALSAFRLTTDPFGPLAQNVHWVSNSIPQPWKLALPHNWNILADPPLPRISGFQADWKNDTASQVAKLFCTLVPPDLVPDAPTAFSRIYQAVTEQGVTLGPPETSPEPPAEGILNSWYSVSPAQIQQHPAELRCRVQHRPNLWLVSGMLSLPPNAPAIWMHAKRTMDIVAQTLEIAP